MKLVIPHIHKTLGDIGFFAKISEKGNIDEVKIRVLEGLRQIEGILIGRRVFETPLVISRICGICPTSHILNACQALEKALEIKPSQQTENLRKLITCAQIIQSHSAHIFFMSLADFFDIESEKELIRKFQKEVRDVLLLREFALSIIELVGGRTVHPITPVVGGFSKIPQKQDYKKALERCRKVRRHSLALIKLLKKLEYPQLKRKTLFSSSFSAKEYPHHKGEKIKIGPFACEAGDKVFTPGDFFSNQIEEDLKNPPAKRVKFKGKPYMVGAIARVKNNWKVFDSEAKSFLEEFTKENKLTKEELFENNFYNTFFQSLEILHFLKEIEKSLLELMRAKEEEPRKEFKVSRGSGLGALEAPRGTLFSYFEVDNQGRIADCSIITPTAQFLRNLEEDFKVLYPIIENLSRKKKVRRIKTLIRAYDPCIACAVH